MGAATRVWLLCSRISRGKSKRVITVHRTFPPEVRTRESPTHRQEPGLPLRANRRREVATLWFIALTFGIMALLSLPISRLVPGALRPSSPLEAALGPVEWLLRPLIHLLPQLSPQPKEGSSLTVAFAPHLQAGSGQSQSDSNETGGVTSGSDVRPVPVTPLNPDDIPRLSSGGRAAADRRNGQQAGPAHGPGSSGNHGGQGSGPGRSESHHKQHSNGNGKGNGKGNGNGNGNGH